MPTQHDPDEAQTIGHLLAATARLETKIAGLDGLKASVDALNKAESQRDGRATVWRSLGGFAAAIAISLGGAALSLGFTASSDHDELARVRAELSALQAAEEVEEEVETQRWSQMTQALNDARTTIAVTQEVLARVERQLDTLEHRRTHP